MELIFDREHDRYQFVCASWSQKDVFMAAYSRSLIHIDIKGGKIRIQNDATEVSIANLLVHKDILKQNTI